MSQFCTDSSVNSLLNYSKCVVDQICSSYHRSNELKRIQYLVFAGMISYYGFEHIDEITTVFKKYKFLYIDEAIPDFLSRQSNVSRKSLSFVDDSTMALFHPVYSKSGSASSTGGEIILSKYYNVSPDMFFELATHEVNHAVNSVNRGSCKINGNLVTRMGIYTRNHGLDTRKNYIFEESINTLQAAEITEHILNFANYNIEDRDIKYCLDSMRYAANKKRPGCVYTDTVGMIRPLYNKPDFNRCLKEGRITGYIQNIEKVFDYKAGKNSFCRLSGICDSIFDATSRQMVYKKQIEGSNIVKSFVR